jgi:RimJ/RimL family protein N-acetyltransferase
MGISAGMVTDPLRRAIKMKISKMKEVPEERHPWYTYWLIVPIEEPFGAGMAGFKGYPDGKGEVEIGYGIDPAYRGKGYMTEIVRAMIAWAFESPECTSVIAPDTMKSNPASNRVLEKSGMHVYEETAEAFSWRIDKE